jgi:RND family efflux transporter MFP subunit
MTMKTIHLSPTAAGALLLTSCLALAGCNSSVSSATKGSEKKLAESVIKVRTAHPEVTTISQVLTYTGMIEPVQEVRIAPEIMGKIKKIAVKEGDAVKKGQLLITFDTRLSALQKNQAQAAVKLAEVQVQTVEKEVNRLMPLLDSGAISQGEFDKVKAQYDGAMAGLNQAKAAVDLSGYQLKVSRITAPFDGVVARKMVNEGEVVTPAALGPFGMITLMNLDTVVVKVGVGEKDIPHIAKGLDASVDVDAYPGKSFKGVVENISPAADPMSKAFPVDIHIPNADMKLKAGMFARVGILIRTREGVLTVPEDAILEEKGSKALFIVEKGDIAKKLVVKIGIQSGGLVEILEGNLDPSKEVVVEGNFGLRDGARIIRAK